VIEKFWGIWIHPSSTCTTTITTTTTTTIDLLTYLLPSKVTASLE